MKLANRVLNRTLLARQHLLERSALSAFEMCEHSVGLQAQDSPRPFVGLWSRIADFDPETVSAGLERITPTRKWTAVERDAVDAEANALVAFLEADKRPSVEILDVGADLRP
ncbi:hypothetical protein [Nocardia sp. NPDC049707]|uniref:hypothetical protein n=1 Tax=Nocardia sp. NPDC049707 TaxID=3154735 RepID=UPI00342C2CB5